jgi:protein-S-isoprenylcysteine O-methyltransferase Ste14
VAIDALDAGQVKNLALAAIIAVIVIGLILSLVISALVGRIIALVVMIGLAILLWTQRQSVADHVKNCNTNVSFLGYHVSLSQSDKSKCQQVVNR